jgi:hypothetical protein
MHVFLLFYSGFIISNFKVRVESLDCIPKTLQRCRSVVSSSSATKGFWAELLGIGDFYYELGVQIIEICMATRARNGGMLRWSELLMRLRCKRRALQGQQEISEYEI